MELIGYLAAVIMGLSLGLIGGGGSILTVPILIYFFKQEALIATTESLFVVGAAALLGAIINAKKGFVDFKTGFNFALPSFLGVFLVRKFFLPSLPNSIQITNELVITKAFLVLVSFAILMILASRAMIKSGKASSAKAPAKPSPAKVPTTKFTPADLAAGAQLDPASSTPNTSAPQKNFNYFSVVLNGFFVGCTTGFVGAGGGFLIIPALVILLRLPMKIAVGTSLTIIAANALFGFAISFGDQAIQWPLLLSIFFLGAIGMLLGNHYSTKINEAKLKKGFGYFVLLIGSLILAEQIFKFR